MMPAMTTFGARLCALMTERRVSVRGLARAVPCDPGYISKIRRDLGRPSREMAERIEELLDAAGELVALLPAAPIAPAVLRADEIAAAELSRRVAASNVGSETLDHLELAVDDLAVAYQGTNPAVLLERVREHLRYLSRLLDAKKTLAEHRRLLVIGGWLSLLAATCNIDLHRYAPAV